MKAKGAVIVARVSTDEQAERGYSLPTQLAAMRQYAERLGRPVVEEITDDCSGAIPIADRPGGKRLYALADSGKVDAVIFYTLDRTARDERVLEYLLLKSYLHDRGIELHYTDTGLDPYTMEGNLVGYIKAHAATAERAKITERSTRGRNAKAAAGRWVGSGFTAYGFGREGQKRDSRVIVDEREAATVRKIYTWFVLGDETGAVLSLRGISARLRAEGIDPPDHRRVKADRWLPSTVRGILTNEIYTGRIYYGKTRMVNKQRVKAPRADWVLIMHRPDLAIIDPEIFEAAQERLGVNKVLARQSPKREYLLTGFARCGYCGKALGGGFSSSRRAEGVYEHAFYRCVTHEHSDACSQFRRIWAGRKSDSLVWGWVQDVLSPEKLDQGLEAWRANDDFRGGQIRSILENIDKQAAAAERKMKRLAAAIGDAEEEEAAAALKAELNQASKQRAGLAEERTRRDAELSETALTPEREAMIRTTAAAVRGRIEGANFLQRRELLALLNFKAVFYDDDEGGKRIGATCELDEGVLYLCSRTQQPIGFTLTLSAILPLSGEPGGLAEALFTAAGVPVAAEC